MAYYGESEYILAFPEEDICCSPSYDTYYRLGEYLSKDEVKLLTYLLGNVLDANMKSRIACGRDLFLVLEEKNICSQEILNRISHLLRVIRRYDVIPQLYASAKRKVALDPLEEYVKEKSKSKSSVAHETTPEPQRKKRKSTHSVVTETISDTNDERSSTSSSSEPKRRNSPEETTLEIRKKLTCDVRLRVRAEYCSHDNVLNNSVTSNKRHPLERQFEKFVLASNILRVRDLGYIICDIKFSEITYLDAFWRDYLNGSLLEALKDLRYI